MAEGSYAQAVEFFAKATEARPGQALPRLQMARALLATGESAKAREQIEAALEIDGSSSDAWNTMGRVELAEGDRDAAIASFQRAVDEDEDNSYAWNNLGYVLIEAQRYEESVTALENATTGRKPTSYMWNNLGMAYEHLDMLVEARAAYRQGADLGSTKAQANLARLEGVVSLKRKQALDAGPEGAVDNSVEDAPSLDEAVEGNQDGAVEVESVP
jgi:Flp pilus assembly protein TadD